MHWQIAETPKEFNQCCELRAREYGRYYEHMDAGSYCDRWDNEQLPDGSMQAYTLYVRHEGHTVGTARLLIANHPGFPPLDCESDYLIKTPNGIIAEMAHIAHLSRPVIMGEIGKLAVAKSARSVSADIIRELAHGMAYIARRVGIELVFAVMAPIPAMAVAATGMPLRSVEHLSINDEDEESLRFMVRMHEYFFPGLAKQYPWLHDFAYHQNAPIDELRSVVARSASQIRLYWNFSEFIIDTLEEEAASVSW